MSSGCFDVLAFSVLVFFFFFNDTATTEIYTLSLHDALPILQGRTPAVFFILAAGATSARLRFADRSEEHTSELQSQSNLVCRLLLEKKKQVDQLVDIVAASLRELAV